MLLVCPAAAYNSYEQLEAMNCRRLLETPISCRSGKLVVQVKPQCDLTGQIVGAWLGVSGFRAN